jgi:hypothetical protein
MVTLKKPTPICPLCGEPVELETSNTDTNGAAVHEDCYAAKVLAKEHQKKYTE